MEKMSEKILKHTLEIIYLLTGEVSLLQHLTNSLIMIEMNKDKVITDRIMNHALEIIYLLTGEEYTIIKKNLPHSSIHQLAGERYIEGLKEKMDENLKTLGILSNRCSGPQEENIDTGSEEEDDEIDEKDILQVTISSDLYAVNSVSSERYWDIRKYPVCVIPFFRVPARSIQRNREHSNVKSLAVSKLKKEENAVVRNRLQVKEEEIPVNISEGPNIVKKLTNPMLEQKVQADEVVGQNVKEEEIPLYINNDGSTSRNTPAQQCRSRNMDICHEQYLGASPVSNTQNENDSSYVQDLDPELNSHVELSLTESRLSTHKDNTSEEETIVYTRKPSRETDKVVPNNKNSSAMENNCSESTENDISFNSQSLTHRSILTGGKQFVCSECGKCFSRKSNLVRHKGHHTGLKPFACSECGKCFSQKSGLSYHERIHAGVKPFVCSECGKCFGQKSHLINHQSTHIGIKPFACSDCGKCFSQKSNLVSHERTHTGVKPYACSECGKCFSRKSLLGSHKKIHGKPIL